MTIDTSCGTIEIPDANHAGWLPIAKAVFVAANDERSDSTEASMSVGDWMLIGASLLWVAPSGFSEEPVSYLGLGEFLTVASSTEALAQKDAMFA